MRPPSWTLKPVWGARDSNRRTWPNPEHGRWNTETEPHLNRMNVRAVSANPVILCSLLLDLNLQGYGLFSRSSSHGICSHPPLAWLIEFRPPSGEKHMMVNKNEKPSPTMNELHVELRCLEWANELSQESLTSDHKCG